MNKTIIAIALICIGISAMFIYVGHKSKIYGAKLACYNSDMYLNEDFECEPKKSTKSTRNWTEIPSLQSKKYQNVREMLNLMQKPPYSCANVGFNGVF
jgi:hypothetical protein